MDPRSKAEAVLGKPMTDDAEFVAIARVAKTQGRHGEVAAALLTDFPELFASRKKVFARSENNGRAKLAPVAEQVRRELELE